MGGHELSARGAGTRALILDAAVDAFAESGYAAASVREIAARCGLTHPALLYHFPTKAALLMAVLERRDSVGAPGGGMDALHGEDLLAHLVETAARNAAAPGIVELFATLAGEATAPSHPAHDFFVARYASLLGMVERAYRELAEDGRLTPGVDPADAARRLVAVMDGLQVQWLLDRSVDMAAGVAAQVSAHIVTPG
ncbi:TetR/AcrR family transcriptional regulator [Demequina sp. SYSU T00039]|uniref:TetR/AcrR family transcriptional regulator n=1 Tax=Demequina lignilytica TaxID=3051663 RepID=A0AAW7M8C2_9MICO|nr:MULTISPECIES: TetR/AcrR family transcriptional regulator [unclassified Demequina]MDN4478406.1 TetR/AcrR family transcriptional regulator [Demequina sp. SYSU T00039-1]MDN4487087.1 TetR/AcrR family transcriptional regulator [Demequina sp. SYSU T00039]MDN4489798.1 TetR/AcrR family transcriptional regulator [Demequina sp. SYSU T00068]